MLTLHPVTKRHGATAVDDLSLEVRHGEVFGLLGPNGAGKTTTVAMSVGLLAPDAGEVRIGTWGSPRNPSVRRRVGVAPQSLAVYDDLTGGGAVPLFAEMAFPCGILLAVGLVTFAIGAKSFRTV